MAAVTKLNSPGQTRSAPPLRGGVGVVNLRIAIVSAAALLLFSPSVHADAIGGLDVDPEAFLADAPTPTTEWSSIAITTEFPVNATGNLTIHGTADAAEGYRLTYVELFVDDHNVGRANGTSVWSLTIPTSSFVDGTHRLQATAYASPKWVQLPAQPGGSTLASFTTRNDVVAEPLFEQRVTFTGAQTVSWTLKLEHDYKDVRVVIETLAGSPSGQIVATYKDADPSSHKPYWLVTSGAAGGLGVVGKPSERGLPAGGVLSLQGIVVGSGAVRIVVDGLRADA